MSLRGSTARIDNHEGEIANLPGMRRCRHSAGAGAVYILGVVFPGFIPDASVNRLVDSMVSRLCQRQALVLCDHAKSRSGAAGVTAERSHDISGRNCLSKPEENQSLYRGSDSVASGDCAGSRAGNRIAAIDACESPVGIHAGNGPGSRDFGTAGRAADRQDGFDDGTPGTGICGARIGSFAKGGFVAGDSTAHDTVYPGCGDLCVCSVTERVTRVTVPGHSGERNVADSCLATTPLFCQPAGCCRIVCHNSDWRSGSRSHDQADRSADLSRIPVSLGGAMRCETACLPFKRHRECLPRQRTLISAFVRVESLVHDVQSAR